MRLGSLGGLKQATVRDRIERPLVLSQHDTKGCLPLPFEHVVGLCPFAQGWVPGLSHHWRNDRLVLVETATTVVVTWFVQTCFARREHQWAGFSAVALSAHLTDSEIIEGTGLCM